MSRLIPIARSCIAVVIIAFSSTTLAQGSLEEITVTARKRDESFTDVPVAVNVFTEREIDAAGIETPHDFIALTPNMTLVQTQNAGNSFITIRGLSQARNSDMPVAVLVDGVLLSNPAALNQELFDIEQIEVLKGPQGALYGRNAIGGAITVNTKQPTDEYEAKIKVGGDSGPGYKLQGALSGPVPGLDTLKFRGSISYKDTDGYLDNAFLNTEADPYKDISGRFKLLWQPTDNFTADARFSISQIDTTALYFVINLDVLGVLPGLGAPPIPADQVNNSNYTGVPITVNNPGVGEKDMLNASLKLDYETDFGTFTAISAYDDLEELLTGDAFDFRPVPQAFFFAAPPAFGGFGADLNQSQWLTVESYSQEFRFTSPAAERLRWIAGVYFIKTDRFISTGNMIDLGTGVNAVYEQPRSNTGFPFDFSVDNPQATFLSDSQDNFAWAVFAETSFDVNEQLEVSVALRYDRDTREQTTETPPGFIPAPLVGIANTGDVREETWDALQPKFTLRYKPMDNLSLYASASRGFRSGGFNQSGVATAGVAGVFDTYDEQIADTYEVGVKAQFFDNRLSTSLSGFYTDMEGAYYFIFLVDSSTQNLGSLDEVRYIGLEFEAAAKIFEGLDVNFGLGLTDSEIKADAQIPNVVGQQAPLNSDFTINLGGTFRQPIPAFGGLEFFVRTDYQIIGKTYWGPGDPGTSPLPWDEAPRDSVSLLDIRGGLQGDNWALTAWTKNALNEEYNGEFTHPFVWKAPPVRWGVDFMYRY